MILFPSCLGFMAKMTTPAKLGFGRFSGSAGVSIMRHTDSVTVTATDLHSIFTVAARPAHDQYPEPPGVSLTDDQLRAVVVPARDFAEACQRVEKLTRKDGRTADGVLRNVCAAVAGPVATRMIGYSAATGTKVETVATNELGQFPPTTSVMIADAAAETVGETWVDPELLARTLDGMAALGVRRVKIEFKVKGKPSAENPPKVMITAEETEKAKFPQSIYQAKAVLMPLIG
jgi:hypothetical protein